MVEALLYIGIVLIIIGIIAYVLGAQGIAGMTASLGKNLLIAGLVIGAILIVLRFIF